MFKVIQPQFARLHLTSPSHDEVAQIQKEYDFHELIIEDIIELSGENKVEYYEEDNAVSLLVNFPKYDYQAEKYIHNPFVIIVSEKYVLSVSKYGSKHIDKFAIFAQKKTYLAEDDSTPTFDLVYDIIDLMYDKSVKGLNKASQDVLGLQDSIETHHQVEKQLLEDLMTKKINMIVLQHIFRPQRQMLHELKGSLKKILHTDREEMEDVRLYIEDLDSKLDKILDSISLNYESLKSLTESYRSMIDLQTNQIITRLTVVTVATGFMAVIAGLFGMNVPIPGSEYPLMFWVIIFLSFILVVLGYLALRWRKRL